MRRFPAEQIVGAARVTDQDRRVARSARSGIYLDRSPGDGLSDVDHLPDGVTLGVRLIAGATRGAIEEIVERPNLRVRDIRHMYVVAHTGAVRRVEVGAEHVERAAITRRSERKRNVVCLRFLCFV